MSEGQSVTTPTERAQSILDDDQTLLNLVDTGGETEYARIYLAFVHGTNQKGDEMLWINYIWLSKPKAYDSDMWGENGIAIRLVDGMVGEMRRALIRSLATISEGEPEPPIFTEVDP